MAQSVANHPRKASRRRGSIYAVVLAMAILVSLIGLSAVAVGRINLRTASATGDSATAELLAVSAVEHAIAVLNIEAGWRGNSLYFGEQPTDPVQLGHGTFWWKLKDELDGDIRFTSGGIQPVRVFGAAAAGDARRTYSVVLVPTGANILANPGIEAGVTPYEPESGNCTLEVSGTSPRSGLRSLRAYNRTDHYAGPRQEVTTKIVSGRSYYAEAWMRMATAEEVPRLALVVRGSGGLLGLSNWEQVFRAAPATPVGLDWTKVGVAINPSFDGTIDRIYWRIETSSTSQEFWVDDVKLIESAASGTVTPMAPARETWRQEPVE